MTESVFYQSLVVIFVGPAGGSNIVSNNTLIANVVGPCGRMIFPKTCIICIYIYICFLMLQGPAGGVVLDKSPLAEVARRCGQIVSFVCCFIYNYCCQFWYGPVGGLCDCCLSLFSARVSPCRCLLSLFTCVVGPYGRVIFV